MGDESRSTQQNPQKEKVKKNTPMSHDSIQDLE